MTAPSPTLGDVLRAFAAGCRGRMTLAQRALVHCLERCHTAELGGHLYRCDQCGHERTAYNSCGNRHCPSCLGHKSADWLRAREAELLPVPYYHVVFTLPKELAALALGNKKVLYALLFKAASSTLLDLAADPRHLGARIGFLAILHTWTQTLLHHPHLHCVVPGGGLSPDGARWISCKPGFFLPVRVLSRLFRGRMLALVDKAYRSGQLRFAGSTAALADPRAWSRLLRALRKKNWVVYAKAPFGSPEQVLKYLARYTHRVAISDRRILSIDGDSVRFRYRDRTRDKSRVMTLSGTEFVRRFVLHVLPAHFVRIRYFGLLASRHRTEHTHRCRRLLAERPPAAALRPAEAPAPAPRPAAPSLACPACATGHLARVAVVPPSAAPRAPP